mmetsp:Transcript_30416/g.55168  ORF Transcript_30416/g.55168 Transcript_30416/m.55168 type:complete len:694 (-) Transcript_30416:26-2107(-)|eukprot:CAMPEP_0202013050 /NCGR_PEP_ID=MMETSP0905-20130828/25010_1 /ASSEMBLY_ACC=CAM_ASM_000554 /TAXON_ID=420261 /ORGANISM="Thalassiosira antarctica, Strain CCMP982" /LENGTH=693 /DNA_ID=CAMNT_0048572463 /DNA_START=58 /DNA_END=2139 /DNA_ORIENTATION=-
MSESSNTNNKEPPMDGSDNDAAQDNWESGLRRRRGGRNSTRNDDGNDEPQQENIEGRPNDNSRDRSTQNTQNNSSRQTNITPGPAAAGRSYANGIGASGGPSCGNGGAVGVLTSHAGVHNDRGTFGGAPSTPFKTPTKDADLVAVTPSSATTSGETAESTLLTQSPLSIRRRRSSNRGAAAPSLRRQYQLLRSQIVLLLGSASIGLVLFLFYALPLAAFVSLALMMSSISALFPVARSVIRARYEMELEHPLGLTRYLPDSMRVFLTETSLHEFMADGTFFMEYRYLLLYFMPGLQPDQVMNFINELPPRHREALLQPGLGRLMPSVMGHLMRTDNNDRGPANIDPLLLENDDDVSTASGLTIDREHQEEGGESDGADAQVTLLDAVTGLRRTLAGFPLDNGAPNTGNVASVAPGETPAGLHVAMQSSNSPIANITQVNAETCDDNQDDDNSSFDFSVDLSAQGLTNMLGNRNADAAPATPTAPANNSQRRNVIVELPQSSDLDPNHPDDQNQEEIQQQYELEGRILSEAASAAVANFSAQASAAARETASEAVVATSSWGIRAGALTGLIAGGGGIVAAVLANHQVGSTSPLFVTLGIMSGSRRNADSGSSSSGGADGSSGNANDEVPERQNGSSSQWIQGLFATSAFGFVGAGFAYFIRNRARAVIAANREKVLKDAPDREDGVDKPVRSE